MSQRANGHKPIDSLTHGLRLAEMRRDFFEFGETSQFQFGEDEFVVDADFVAPAVGRDEIHGREFVLVLLQQGFRHTDGFGQVASSSAVLDVNLHGFTSLRFQA